MSLRCAPPSPAELSCTAPTAVWNCCHPPTPHPAGPVLYTYWVHYGVTYPIGWFGLAIVALEINLIAAKSRTVSQHSNSNVTQANSYSIRSSTTSKPGALWPWIAVRKVMANQQEVVVQSYTRSDWCCVILLTEQWQETTISFTNSDVFLPIPVNSFLLWRT